MFPSVWRIKELVSKKLQTYSKSYIWYIKELEFESKLIWLKMMLFQQSSLDQMSLHHPRLTEMLEYAFPDHLSQKKSFLLSNPNPFNINWC